MAAAARPVTQDCHSVTGSGLIGYGLIGNVRLVLLPPAHIIELILLGHNVAESTVQVRRVHRRRIMRR